MVSGPEMYGALRAATKDLEKGSSFTINRIDVLDLAKLTASDLVDIGYNEETARQVSAALLKDDLDPLGKSMGLNLTVSHDAPRLLPTE